MAITSVGYTGTVGDVDWAKLVPRAGGVTQGVDDFAALRVSISAGTREVAIAGGIAWACGVMAASSGAEALTLASVPSGVRWDLIVLRYNWATRITSLAVVPGGSAKQIPARQNIPGTVYEQPIALCRVNAGQPAVQEVIDLRCVPSDNGLIAFDDLALSYLTRIGTQVRIGDVLWTRTVTATGSPRWASTDVTDTGWVNVPLGPKWDAVSGYPTRVRRIGPLAHLRGAVTAKSGASYENLATVPSLFRPSASIPLGATVTQSKAYGELFVNANGLVWISDLYRYGSNPVGNVVMLHGTWPVG
ncbi:hypothetical protein [Microbacterium sp. NPDC078849]|uniref:hypothetical protein n=1 Tax=unclassified Microbacterium TaxID=2609290 RepID=UPI00344CB082